MEVLGPEMPDPALWSNGWREGSANQQEQLFNLHGGGVAGKSGGPLYYTVMPCDGTGMFKLCELIQGKQHSI